MATPLVEKLVESAALLRRGEAIYFVAPAEVVYERLRRLGLYPEDIERILRRGECEKIVKAEGNFIACPIAKATDRGVEVMMHNVVLMEAALEYLKRLLRVK